MTGPTTIRRSAAGCDCYRATSLGATAPAVAAHRRAPPRHPITLAKLVAPDSPYSPIGLGPPPHQSGGTTCALTHGLTDGQAAGYKTHQRYPMEIAASALWAVKSARGRCNRWPAVVNSRTTANHHRRRLGSTQTALRRNQPAPHLRQGVCRKTSLLCKRHYGLSLRTQT